MIALKSSMSIFQSTKPVSKLITVYSQCMFSSRKRFVKDSPKYLKREVGRPDPDQIDQDNFK